MHQSVWRWKWLFCQSNYVLQRLRLCRTSDTVFRREIDSRRQWGYGTCYGGIVSPLRRSVALEQWRIIKFQNFTSFFRYICPSLVWSLTGLVDLHCQKCRWSWSLILNNTSIMDCKSSELKFPLTQQYFKFFKYTSYIFPFDQNAFRSSSLYPNSQWMLNQSSHRSGH